MSKIVILGGGISGLVTAITLANKGIATTVIDKNSSYDYSNDLRNISLTQHSKKFFENNNIWEELEDFVAPVFDIYVIDNKSPNTLHFGADDTTYESLGYMIPYKYLHASLLSVADRYEMIEKMYGVNYSAIHFLEDNKAVISLDNGTQLDADLIIACDGKNSPAKQEYFSKLIERDYKETALVFNIAHEHPHEGTAIEHFTCNGTFAVLPMKNQNESSIVWSLKNAAAGVYLKMSTEELESHVLDAIGMSYGKISISSKIATHKLYAEVVKTYFHKNIVLVSDSAHTIHPLAGQGLNQGIRDVESLTQIIEETLSLGLEIGSRELQQYQKSRRLANLCMFGAMDIFDRVFVNNYPVLSTIRPYLLGIADKCSFLKRWCIS